MLQPEQKKFNFEDLFIFDLANNHKGKLEIGRQIVAEFAAVAKQEGVRAAIKFQLRDLDTLVHPDHKENSNFSYIEYFQKNSLMPSDYQVLVNDIKDNGLITMATPFDEPSVDLLVKLGIDIVKIASSSAVDWPLLEKISQTEKPVVFSTGGLNIEQIDNLVSFFGHRGINFAILHCVAIYPTPPEKLDLGRIALYKNRYPDVTIGFSTHENPDNLDAIKIAYAKGARIFERHIGIETDTIKLNAYSSTPQQIRAWIKAYKLGRSMAEEYSFFQKEEQETLEQFQRGVYALKSIPKGKTIERSDVFFAMPLQAGQLKSGDFKKIVATKDYEAGGAILALEKSKGLSRKGIIYKAIHDAKGQLNLARIRVNYDSNVELSHHKGLENFPKIGAFIIDCINREYCKKIIVILPGQSHPAHYHKKKEETFQILSGSLYVEIEGRIRTAEPGDTLLIPRGVWHSFSSSDGAIFEEISSTHYNDDSFYADMLINSMPRENRKTKLVNWGRHQFDDLDEKGDNTIEGSMT